MKERIDVLLTEKGYFPSREKAKTSIMAGIVFINNQRVDKPGTLIDTEAEILVKDQGCPYVGRGGLKLKKAVDEFNLNLKDCICVDMGASTGGFTDCMLQEGASKVYAIDVGYGQLDYRLRTNPQVINMEKTNIRYLDLDLIKEPIDFISIDVSFISVKLILPVAAKLLKDNGTIICLVKPQFEAGREQVGKNGIIKDPKVHQEVIEKVREYGNQVGLIENGLIDSPIKGAKGNTEFLMRFVKREEE